MSFRFGNFDSRARLKRAFADQHQRIERRQPDGQLAQPARGVVEHFDLVVNRQSSPG
jgi:hypothetical protein